MNSQKKFTIAGIMIISLITILSILGPITKNPTTEIRITTNNGIIENQLINEIPVGVYDIENQECRLYSKYKDYGYLKQ